MKPNAVFLGKEIKLEEVQSPHEKIGYWFSETIKVQNI